MASPGQLVDNNPPCYYCLQPVDKKATHLVLKCTQNCLNAGRLVDHSCHRQQLAHYRKNGGRSNFKDCCPKRPGDTCHGAHMVHEVTPKNERKKEQRIAAAQTHQPPPKRGPSSAARTPPSKGQQPAPSSRGPHGMPSGGAAAAGGGGGGSGSRRSSCSDGGCSCCTGGSDVHSRSSGCSYDTGCDTGGSIDGGGTFLQDYFPPAPTKPGPPPLCYADGFVPEYGFAPAVLYAAGGIQMTMNSVVRGPETFYFDSLGGEPRGVDGGPRARAHCFDVAGDGLYTSASQGPKPAALPPSPVQYEDLFPPPAGGHQPGARSAGRVWPPTRPKPSTSYAAAVARPGPAPLQCADSYPHLAAATAVAAAAAAASAAEAGTATATGALAASPPPSPPPARRGAYDSGEEAILQYDLLLLDSSNGMVLVQYGGVFHGGVDRPARRCARCSKLRVAVWCSEAQRRSAWLACIPQHWPSAEAWKKEV